MLRRCLLLSVRYKPSGMAGLAADSHKENIKVRCHDATAGVNLDIGGEILTAK